MKYNNSTQIRKMYNAKAEVSTKSNIFSDIGSERHLISFIVRDSPSYFVNVTCWGGFEFIHHIATSFKVGDIGIVYHGKVVNFYINAYHEFILKYKTWIEAII